MNGYNFFTLKFFAVVYTDYTIGVNPGGLGVAAPRFWAGESWGRGRVVKYYYILSCTGSMFESGDF